MNENDFKDFVLIIKSAGFIDANMIGSQNNLNMAYILYLTLRDQGMIKADIQRFVRRWFVLSALTGRYSGSSESTIDHDIRQIDTQGIGSYFRDVEQSELSDAFWKSGLPQAMDTPVASSPYFRLFEAAQVVMKDYGFLSKDYFVQALIEVKSDVHHIFPKDYLRKNGYQKGMYNQIANYVVTQSEINMAIGNKAPKVYFTELIEQCNGGLVRYGAIDHLPTLQANFEMNCIPAEMQQYEVEDYPEFLAERRNLMAQKLRRYYEKL